MVEDIYKLKNQVIARMNSEIATRGADRFDVEEFGKMADIVKDLAEAEESCWEAEYYRSVTEAMGGQQGYGYSGGNGGGSQGGSQGYPMNENWGYDQMQPMMGYRSSGRGSANQYGGRRGYPNMGYHDKIDSLRTALHSASPEEKGLMKEEIRKLYEEK